MSGVLEISVVVPVYGSPDLIPTLCQRLHNSVGELTQEYELILVFDDSPDDGWDRICKECEEDARTKGVKLSRNFGQHYAITAGLEYAEGEWVVVMDCDLQDRPEEIPNLLNKAQEDDVDMVLAQRHFRSDTQIKKLSSYCFHKVFSYLTGAKSEASIGNFGIYSNRSIRAYLAMRDHIRCFAIMMQWVGFSKSYLTVQHDSRASGSSNYTFSRLLHLALNTALSFSDKPLFLTLKLGGTICILSAIMGVRTLYKFFLGGIAVSGYTSLILSVWFLSGAIIFIIGVVGLYIGKIFDRVKDRPLYIVADRLNFKEEE